MGGWWAEASVPLRILSASLSVTNIKTVWPVLASHCCCNILPQTQRFKILFSYDSGGQKFKIGLTGLKSRCQHWLNSFLDTPGENPFPSFSSF